MKKILLIMSAIIFLSNGNCFAETLVRVSDYTVDEFYREYNKVANNVTQNYLTANQYPILGKEGGTYNNYLMICGTKSGGVATVVILRANKQGHVSAISVMTPMKNKESVSIGAEVMKNIVNVLGLNEMQGQIMLENISNGNNPAFQYCYSTKRYIFMKAFLDKASGLYNTDFYAAVD